MNKTFVIATFLILLLVVSTVILLLRLDEEELSKAVIAQVESLSGLHLAVEEITLHPFRGLLLRNGTVAGSLPSGQLSARVDLLTMKYRIWPLMWGEVVVDEIVIDGPVAELVSRQPAVRRATTVQAETKEERRARRRRRRAEKVSSTYSAAAGDLQEVGSVRLSIKVLEIRGLQFTARTADSDSVDLRLEDVYAVLRDLDFDPEAGTPSGAIAGSGEFASGRIAQGDFEALESRGIVNFGEGLAKLEKLELRTAHARLASGRFLGSLEKDPPDFSFGLRGEFDLNGAVGFDGDDGFGEISLELQGTGEGPELEMLAGEGAMTLSEGTIPRLPAIAELEDLVGLPILTGRAYGTTIISYRLEGSALVLEPFELSGDGGMLQGSGVVDLAGLVDLQVSVRLPTDRVQDVGVSGRLLASLADGDGYVSIPLVIGGTIEDPRVSLGIDGLSEVAREADDDWVEQLLEDAKQEARDWLQEHLRSEPDG